MNQVWSGWPLPQPFSPEGRNHTDRHPTLRQNLRYNADFDPDFALFRQDHTTDDQIWTDLRKRQNQAIFQGLKNEP